MNSHKIQILPLRRSLPPSQSPEGDQGQDTTSGLGAINRHVPVTKKTRTSKPKVRTGCLTCKIRRIKCDEEKPACRRCRSTGRTCDGYVEPTPRKKADPEAAMQLLLTRNPSCPRGTPAETRALEFFYHVTAPQLSSYFDADFWTRLVFQMSHGEESVKHAMIALGTLAEQRDRTTYLIPNLRSVPAGDPLALSLPIVRNVASANDPFALLHYNKAINALAAKLEQPGTPVEVALLACILFVCVEFMRGDIEPALRHYQGGMNIAINSLAKDESSSTAVQRSRGIKENMLPFFQRLELLSALFGNDSSWDYSVDLYEAVPRQFSSMRDARDSIVHLLNLALRFIRSVKYRKYEKLFLPDDIARQNVLRGQINAWKLAFDTLLLSKHITATDLDAAKVLRIHSIVAELWLEISTRCDETAVDDFNTEFRTAVSLAEAIQGVFVGFNEQRDRSGATFLFDMEVVSPLYFVCIKCRHPEIRRRATKLLQSTVRREGLWDSHMAGAVAERLMAIEEKHLTVLDGSELPREEHRVHNLHIDSESGITARKHMLTYYTKPYGPDGPWKVWQEDLILHEGPSGDSESEFTFEVISGPTYEVHDMLFPLRPFIPPSGPKAGVVTEENDIAIEDSPSSNETL